MKRLSLISSMIKSAGWEGGTLEVEFSNGSVHRYENVPEGVADAFMNAPSSGKYFHQNIRDVYPTRKVK